MTDGTINYMLWFKSYGFDQVIFIVWIGFSWFKKYFSFLNLTRYLNLHWKMHFRAIYSIQHAKFWCFLSLRPNHSAHSGKNKTSEILWEFFTIQLLKVNLNPGYQPHQPKTILTTFNVTSNTYLKKTFYLSSQFYQVQSPFR